MNFQSKSDFYISHKSRCYEEASMERLSQDTMIY
jgi:hypothetical protein